MSVIRLATLLASTCVVAIAGLTLSGTLPSTPWLFIEFVFVGLALLLARRERHDRSHQS
jgi:hypothetical protein